MKADLGHSVSERVYGTTLCLPGELFSPPTDPASLDPTSYVDRLKRTLHKLQPPPHRLSSTATYVPNDLQTCAHVFIRRDAVRKPLQPPYDGPFKVISRTPKHFKVDLGNRTDSISIDRLKCAHLNTELVLPVSPTPDAPQSTSTPEDPEARRTRSGRRVHFPDRYGLVVYH